jgi:hypothetical protein
MKLFNGAEAYWIKRGLELVKEAAKKEIDKAEKAGKNPIMTKGFIDMQIDQTEKKLESLTKLQNNG